MEHEVMFACLAWFAAGIFVGFLSALNWQPKREK